MVASRGSSYMVFLSWRSTVAASTIRLTVEFSCRIWSSSLILKSSVNRTVAPRSSDLWPYRPRHSIGLDICSVMSFVQFYLTVHYLWSHLECWLNQSINHSVCIWRHNSSVEITFGRRGEPRDQSRVNRWVFRAREDCSVEVAVLTFSGSDSM